MDQKGTISASLRTATVTVAPNERCINKFLQQQHEVTTSATATITTAPSLPSLNFVDRQLCVGGDGLDQLSMTGGCPSLSNTGDVGGALETSDGILIGIYSRLTPPISLTERSDVESSTADNLHANHANRNAPVTNDCGGSGRGRYYDIFTRIAYYRGWIQRVVEERYDGGVCSISRLLDSPLRCPRGTWGDAEGYAPLKGLLGGGGPLSSLATSTSTRANALASTADHTAMGTAMGTAMEGSSSPSSAALHTAPDYKTSALCRACPAGRYGATEGLETSDCSGICTEGYFCAAGSVTSTQEACDAPHAHCPRGTAEPRITVAGYISVPNGTMAIARHLQAIDARLAPELTQQSLAGGLGSKNNDDGLSNQVDKNIHMASVRSSLFSKAALSGRHLATVPNYIDQVQCPPGSFCRRGIKYPCPVGTYGSSPGLSNPRCSGPCHAGYYCPQGSPDPVPCRAGQWCDGNSTVPCPAGRYGSPGALLGSPLCSGPCSKGHWCPTGSTMKTEKFCRGGTYGGQAGLGSPSCSGSCHPGYYCPSDGLSISPTRFECGSGVLLVFPINGGSSNNNNNNNGAKVFCPLGSAKPIGVSDGFYSVGGGSDAIDVAYGAEKEHGEVQLLYSMLRSSQKQCRPGTFCVDGIRKYCPEGQFGIDFGQTINTCTGQCQLGYYCPLGSTSAEQMRCPAGRFGSTHALKNPQCSGPCALGHYCPSNSTNARQVPCPAGRYGSVVGLVDENCASTRVSTTMLHLPNLPNLPNIPNSLETGSAAYAAGCVGLVHGVGGGGLIGHTMSGGVDSTHGTGDMTSTTTQCGPNNVHYCSPGYYCPLASVSPTQKRCGNASVYCPLGSASPTLAPPGYYTILGLPVEGEHRLQDGGDGNGVDSDLRRKGAYDMGGTSVQEAQTRSDALICPLGHYCSRGIKRPCPRGRFGSTAGLFSRECSGKSGAGHFTREGSTSAQQYKCNPGRYADREGSSSASCVGPCDHGFYCKAGSTSRRAMHCGHRGVFCPIGSKKPTRASRGYYTLPLDPPARPDGWAKERRKQSICPKGSYCVQGVKRDCPKGRFGKSSGLYKVGCSGVCRDGYYCPAGSTSAYQVPCPHGTFGGAKGLGSLEECTKCPNGMVCDLDGDASPTREPRNR